MVLFISTEAMEKERAIVGGNLVRSSFLKWFGGMEAERV